jgi:uncharacterized protein (TIGR01777 family)
MTRILVAGGSGFIGAALVERLLDDGHLVSVLGRDAGRIRLRFGSRARPVVWGNADEPAFVEEVSGHDVVYNLTGEESVHGRHLPGEKQRIRDSRVKSTRVLVEALTVAPVRPRLLVSASTVGYYGTVEGQSVDESWPMGTGYLPELCYEWEAAALRAEAQGSRVIVARLGTVLGAKGGVFPAMLRPFALGLGGRVGDGHQGVSFVSLVDCVRALEFCMTLPELRDPVNITAPAPTDRQGVALAMARILRKPNWLPVPRILLRALYGDGAEALDMAQRVLPSVLLAQGFRFQHPTIDAVVAAAALSESS